MRLSKNLKREIFRTEYEQHTPNTGETGTALVMRSPEPTNFSFTHLEA